MGAEEKNKTEILSRIAIDLFVKSQGGDDLACKINHLREVLKKIIESDDTIFGKLRGLVESFREIIPDENQRYNAAIKALSTTSKISPQDIVKAVSNQAEELKILEKILLSVPFGRRDEFNVKEARSREIKAEIAKLRERIGQLESEENEIHSSIAIREKNTELVSNAVGELFREITAEITDINHKVAKATAVSAAPQPIQPSVPVKSDVPAASAAPQPILPKEPVKTDILVPKTEVNEQKIEIIEPSAPQERELQKKCPMCGGRMDLSSGEKKWRCYSCAYEESIKEKVVSAPEQDTPEPAAPQETEWQKKCPMCGGRMDFYSHEKKWICFSCAFEEAEGGDVQGKTEEKIEFTSEPEPAPVAKPISEPPSFTVPLADLPFNDYQETKKRPSPSQSQPSPKKKACPGCRKKMSWYENEKAWRCSFCGYERSI